MTLDEYFRTHSDALRQTLSRQFPRFVTHVGDAVQHAALRAVEHESEVRDLPRYVHTVATRYMLDIARGDRRFVNDGEQEVAHAPAPVYDSDGEWLREQQRQCLLSSLEHLSPLQQRLITLKHIECRDYDVIAATTGLAKSSVGATLFRARKALAELATACVEQALRAVEALQGRTGAGTPIGV